MAVAKHMKRLLACTGFAILVFSMFTLAGCSKEEEVGFGGEVKTAPGAENYKPSNKPGGGGMTVDVNN